MASTGYMKMGLGGAVLYISIKAADWECSETRTQLGKQYVEVTAKPTECQAIMANRARRLPKVE